MNLVDVLMEALKDGDPDAEAYIRKVLGEIKITALSEEDVALLVSLRNEQKNKPKIGHPVPAGRKL